MNDTIFWAIFMSAWTIGLWFVAFKFFYKYVIQEKRCTAKTKGIVKKYTFASRGGDNASVNLPVVVYNVEGKEYKVIGPEYTVYKTIIKKSLTGESSVECREENQALIITKVQNSFINVYKNPLDNLYPIGTEIDVFYNPKKPKLAYVLRYCNKKWMFYFTFFCGLGIVLINFVTTFIGLYIN